MKLDKELYEKVSNLTRTDYEGLYPKDPDEEYVIVFDDKIEAMLENLICKIDDLEEKIEDIIEDRDTNYRRIPVKEQIRED